MVEYEVGIFRPLQSMLNYVDSKIRLHEIQNENEQVYECIKMCLIFVTLEENWDTENIKFFKPLFDVPVYDKLLHRRPDLWTVRLTAWFD